MNKTVTKSNSHQKPNRSEYVEDAVETVGHGSGNFTKGAHRTEDETIGLAADITNAISLVRT